MKTSYRVFAALLFVLFTALIYSCVVDDNFSDTELNDNPGVSLKMAQKIFTHVTQTSQSRAGNLIEKNAKKALVIPNWNTYEVINVHNSQVKLSKVKAIINNPLNYEFELQFLQLEDDYLGVLEAKRFLSISEDGSMEQGAYYYFDFEGRFLHGYQVKEGKIQSKLVLEKEIQESSIFAFLTLFQQIDPSCDPRLPGGLDCFNELDGVVFTVERQEVPTSVDSRSLAFAQYPDFEEYTIPSVSLTDEDSNNRGGGPVGCPEGSGKFLVDGNCECPEGMVENGNWDCVDEIECGQPNDNGKCPCFGADTPEGFDPFGQEDELFANFINTAVGYEIGQDFMKFFSEFSKTLKQSDQFFDLSTVGPTGNRILGAREFVGGGLGIANLGLGLYDYIENPTTQNLLRLSFDAFTTFALPILLPVVAPLVNITVAIADIYSFKDGESGMDALMRNLANLLEDLIDCDLGAGILGSITYSHPDDYIHLITLSRNEITYLT